MHRADASPSSAARVTRDWPAATRSRRILCFRTWHHKSFYTITSTRLLPAQGGDRCPFLVGATFFIHFLFFVGSQSRVVWLPIFLLAQGCIFFLENWWWKSHNNYIFLSGCNKSYISSPLFLVLLLKCTVEAPHVFVFQEQHLQLWFTSCVAVLQWAKSWKCGDLFYVAVD